MMKTNLKRILFFLMNRQNNDLKRTTINMRYVMLTKIDQFWKFYFFNKYVAHAHLRSNYIDMSDYLYFYRDFFLLESIS